MKFRRTLFALCLICAAADFAFSQGKSSVEKDKESEQQPVGVIANVMILDVNGKPLGDVKKEDLKIFEDGVEQKISYFTRKEPTLNLGLLMDNSASLRLQLEKSFDIGKFIISNLREQDEAFIVRFISSDKIEVIENWTSDKSLLNKSLDSMFTEGGASAVIDALYTSAEHLLKRTKENSSRRYALVLVSDCEDRDSFYKLTDLFSIIKGTEIQIFVVALTNALPNDRSYSPTLSILREKSIRNTAENFANNLALKTGGNVYFPTTGESKKKPFSETLKPLIFELQSNYVIGYISTNKNRDNKPRKLRVEIADAANGAKRQGFIRESFIVPKD